MDNLSDLMIATSGGDNTVKLSVISDYKKTTSEYKLVKEQKNGHYEVNTVVMVEKDKKMVVFYGGDD